MAFRSRIIILSILFASLVGCQKAPPPPLSEDVKQQFTACFARIDKTLAEIRAQQGQIDNNDSREYRTLEYYAVGVSDFSTELKKYRAEAEGMGQLPGTFLYSDPHSGGMCDLDAQRKFYEEKLNAPMTPEEKIQANIDSAAKANDFYDHRRQEDDRKHYEAIAKQAKRHYVAEGAGGVKVDTFELGDGSVVHCVHSTGAGGPMIDCH